MRHRCGIVLRCGSDYVSELRTSLQLAHLIVLVSIKDFVQILVQCVVVIFRQSQTHLNLRVHSVAIFVEIVSAT